MSDFDGFTSGQLERIANFFDADEAPFNLDTASLADVLRHCADQLEAGEYHLNADEGLVGGRGPARQLVYGKGHWASEPFIEWRWHVTDHSFIRIQLPARWLPEQAS